MAEEVQAAGADKDVEVLQVVTRLLTALRQAQAAAVGVDLDKIKAATLEIEDIIATGTAIKVKDGDFSGNISIKGVRAGMQSASVPKR